MKKYLAIVDESSLDLLTKIWLEKSNTRLLCIYTSYARFVCNGLCNTQSCSEINSSKIWIYSSMWRLEDLPSQMNRKQLKIHAIQFLHSKKNTSLQKASDTFWFAEIELAFFCWDRVGNSELQWNEIHEESKTPHQKIVTHFLGQKNVCSTRFSLVDFFTPGLTGILT